MGHINRTSRWMTALAVVALSLGPATGALAHNVVEDRDPTADSVVSTSPVTVTISTNDNFLDTGGATRGFALVAQDASGLLYGDGCVSINERSMSATIALGEPGTYTVLYQFVSADGHTLQDDYSFVFEPGPDHTPATGLAAAPVCGESTEAPTTQSTAPDVTATVPEPTAVAQESVSLIPTVAGVIVLIVVLIGLGVSGLRKRQGKS